VTAIGDGAVDDSPDYQQIGRFIYGTARLESELAGLLRALGIEKAEDTELSANAGQAVALFSALPVDAADKAQCSALMWEIAAFGELRDALFDRITGMPPVELGARIDDIAQWAHELRRLRSIAGD
jgi:hypothetical protein